MTAPVLFQALPPLSPEEYASLEQSIQEHGVLVPVVVDEAGVVIDGHHRQKITESLGVRCPTETRVGLTEQQKRTQALTMNADRRQLSREQRRALVEASLRADPNLSNREHARRTGVDHKTVETVRDPLESTGEIPQSDTRRSADGRTRPSRPDHWRPEGTGNAEARAAYITSGGELLDERPPRDQTTGETTDESEVERDIRDRDVIKGDSPIGRLSRGMQDDARPKRRALTDAFFDAAYELTKVTERIERLVADDRFPQNAEKVAAKHRSDLTRARDALQGVLDRLPSA